MNEKRQPGQWRVAKPAVLIGLVAAILRISIPYLGRFLFPPVLFFLVVLVEPLFIGTAAYWSTHRRTEAGMVSRTVASPYAVAGLAVLVSAFLAILLGVAYNTLVDSQAFLPFVPGLVLVELLRTLIPNLLFAAGTVYFLAHAAKAMRASAGDLIRLGLALTGLDLLGFLAIGPFTPLAFWLGVPAGTLAVIGMITVAYATPQPGRKIEAAAITAANVVLLVLTLKLI